MQTAVFSEILKKYSGMLYLTKLAWVSAERKRRGKIQK